MNAPIKNEIHTFFHCARCVREGQAGKIEAGLTREGLQVWCKRHKMNVIKLSPDGLKEMGSKGPQCECCPGGMHRS
jgi:hypothetical protein